MLGTQERPAVRQDERRYNAYINTPQDYFDECDYPSMNSTAMPRDDYRNELWGKLNSQASSMPVYRPGDPYMNAPVRGYARPTQGYRISEPVYNNIREQERQRKQNKLSQKGKVILAVYIALVVIIATLVIVNTGSLNTGSTKEAASPLAAVETVTSVSDGLYMLDTSATSQQIVTNDFDGFLDKITD